MTQRGWVWAAGRGAFPPPEVTSDGQAGVACREAGTGSRVCLGVRGDGNSEVRATVRVWGCSPRPGVSLPLGKSAAARGGSGYGERPRGQLRKVEAAESLERKEDVPLERRVLRGDGYTGGGCVGAWAPAWDQAWDQA